MATSKAAAIAMINGLTTVEQERYDKEVQIGATHRVDAERQQEMLNLVMAVLDMDINVSRFALVSVRYRSCEEAISLILEPDDGFYRHPFVQYCPKVGDLESGAKTVCYFCKQEWQFHFANEESKEPD